MYNEWLEMEPESKAFVRQGSALLKISSSGKPAKVGFRLAYVVTNIEVTERSPPATVQLHM